MVEFNYLFTPLKVGTMTVPNRIAETTYSIGTGRKDRLPDEEFIEHHLQKARGASSSPAARKPKPKCSTRSARSPSCGELGRFRARGEELFFQTATVRLTSSRTPPWVRRSS